VLLGLSCWQPFLPGRPGHASRWSCSAENTVKVGHPFAFKVIVTNDGPEVRGHCRPKTSLYGWGYGMSAMRVVQSVQLPAGSRKAYTLIFPWASVGYGFRSSIPVQLLDARGVNWPLGR